MLGLEWKQEKLTSDMEAQKPKALVSEPSGRQAAWDLNRVLEGRRTLYNIFKGWDLERSGEGQRLGVPAGNPGLGT